MCVIEIDQLSADEWLAGGLAVRAFPQLCGAERRASREELAVDFFGPERVLFGSDAPFDIEDGQIFIAETLRSIDAMAVSQETRSAILSKNAARILKVNPH